MSLVYNGSVRQKDDMGMTSEKDARYQFRLPQNLLDAALEKARVQDLSLAQVLRRLLREWVKKDSSGDKGVSTQDTD